MPYSKDNRATSDNAQPRCSRQYPDTRHFPNSQASYLMDTADNGIQVQGANHKCSHSLATMPCISHDKCNQSPPHETCIPSHEKHFRYHPHVSGLCPFLPGLNSSFAAEYTNPESMDRISCLSHKPTSSFPHYQNPSPSHTIRPETAPLQYGISSSFVPSRQSTMSSQQTNNTGVEARASQSQVSTTPRLSDVTTPESIFSAPQRPGTARDGCGEVGTPASTASLGIRASVQKGTMSPAQILAAQDGYLNGLEDSSFSDEWVSGYNRDNQKWLNNNVFHCVPPQPYDNVGTQHLGQNAAYTEAGKYAMNLQSTTQEGTFVPNQGPSGPTMGTTDDWDRVFGFQYLPVPLSFDDLSHEAFESEDNASQSTKQHAHAYQQPSGSAYPEVFDFNAAVAPSAYGSGFANVPPVLVSNAFDSAQGGRNGAGGRARQGQRNAQKDALLVKLRREGKSYKEIMQTGLFDLEESTLRGRYRTLTKSKEQRVRKPTWNDEADQALLDGVDTLAPPTARSSRTKDGLDKVPWKKVAEWMRDKRGCYHYGNATVKKRYQELIKKSRMAREHGSNTY